MIRLTEAQREIFNKLRSSIYKDKLNEVKRILRSDDNDDIQQVLKFCFLDTVLTKKAEITELFWEAADQRTRDFLCTEKVGQERGLMYAFKNKQTDVEGNGGDVQLLKQVIQKVKEHERVMDLGCELRGAIREFDVERVKGLLANCGTDVKSVLEQRVYWNNDGGVDALLVFPLVVDYKRNLDKEEFEKIKEITKLLWDKASPDVRDFWLEDHMVNEEGQNTGGNYIIDSLEERQRMYANIAGEGWLEDFIQEVKDYRQQRDIELNDPILEEADKQMLELTKQESLLIAPIAINTTEPTTDNNPPEKNDTTFWSEHKGKIALGVTGLCVAGAVAAYVLAYPAVALALAVLAAVILMGAGIAKVREKVENPSVEKPFTPQQGV